MPLLRRWAVPLLGLVALASLALVLWAGGTTSGASPAAPSPAGLRSPALHPPGAHYSLVQRLWVALHTGNPEGLRLPEGQRFTVGSDANEDVLEALRQQLLGQPGTPDPATAAALAWFDAHPGSLEEALRVRLAFHCEGDRERLVHHPGQAQDMVCPFDASAAFVRDPATGKWRCPLQDDATHDTFGSRGMMMLLDTMGRPRPGDLERLQKAFPLKPGMDVVDLGAGVGAYTFPWAEEVGPKGKVWSVDIDDQVVGFVKFRAEREKVANVVPHVSQVESLMMPEKSADVAFIVDVNQCTMDPKAFFTPAFASSIRKTLRPGGHLVVAASVEGSKAEAYAEALQGQGFVLERTERVPLDAARVREIAVLRAP